MKTTIAILSALAVAGTLGVSVPAEAAQYHHSAVAQHAKPRFESHGDYAFYNGHRGDRHFHKGWRQYNGYWFPPAAFVGAAIGAAILGGIIHATH